MKNLITFRGVDNMLSPEKTAQDVALLKDARIIILERAISSRNKGRAENYWKFLYGLDEMLAKAIEMIREGG